MYFVHFSNVTLVARAHAHARIVKTSTKDWTSSHGDGPSHSLSSRNSLENMLRDRKLIGQRGYSGAAAADALGTAEKMCISISLNSRKQLVGNAYRRLACCNTSVLRRETVSKACRRFSFWPSMHFGHALLRASRTLKLMKQVGWYHSNKKHDLALHHIGLLDFGRSTSLSQDPFPSSSIPPPSQPRSPSPSSCQLHSGAARYIRFSRVVWVS